MKITLRIIALWILIHISFSVVDGLHDNQAIADVAIIFGNKVNKDGSISERLKARLDCGLSLYQTGRVKKIIVSGGLGSEGYLEADKMKEYLVENGVRDSDIYVDNEGNDTQETVLNSIQIIDSLNFKNAIVVSQYFHITRVKMLYSKHGYKNISSASPQYFEIRDSYSILREFFAFYSELIY